MTNGSVHELNNYFEAPIAQSIGINLTWGTSLVKKQEARSIKKQERGRERRYSCFSRGATIGETWGARHFNKSMGLWWKSMCNSIISKSMACLSIFKKKQASLLLETPARKRSYLELRWSESLNPGLKSKPTTSSTLLEYLLHASFMFILFCNSIFARDLCLRRRRLWRSYCPSMNHAWNYEKNQGLRQEQVESGSSIKGEDIEALNQQAFYFYSSLPYPLLAGIKEEDTEV